MIFLIAYLFVGVAISAFSIGRDGLKVGDILLYLILGLLLWPIFVLALAGMALEKNVSFHRLLNKQLVKRPKCHKK